MKLRCSYESRLCAKTSGLLLVHNDFPKTYVPASSTLLVVLDAGRIAAWRCPSLIPGTGKTSAPTQDHERSRG
jgi:hypothetical protein